MTRAEASISSSGSIVSCITPMRSGGTAESSQLRTGAPCRVVGATEVEERLAGRLGRRAALNEPGQDGVVADLQVVANQAFGEGDRVADEHRHALTAALPAHVVELVVVLGGELAADGLAVRAHEVDDEPAAVAHGGKRPRREVEADEQDRRHERDARDRVGREAARRPVDVDRRDDRDARRERCHDRDELLARHGGGHVALATCFSSAVSTFCTCWLTIGWSTRWPMLPTGPAMRTSASHAMAVVPSLSLRLNAVSMSINAPTPVPFACRRAKSGSCSSVFSKLIFSRSEPRPSGIFTCARQCLSSSTSKLSTPGISFAICPGSLRTPQTVSREAAHVRSPATFIARPPRPERGSPWDREAAPRRGDTDSSCRRRSLRPPPSTRSGAPRRQR